MRVEPFLADTFLRAAVTAVTQGGYNLHQTLDTLPVPIYVTNSEGVITYFNRACIACAGRTPHLGQDSWCITWKLFPAAGEVLPHDQCPMAVAIREKRAVRGIEACAERPDGTRLSFLPYPTPLFGEDGTLSGAVNIFIDVTALRKMQALREQAARARQLADATTDRRTTDSLNSLAAEYEEKARQIENAR
jgi:PAS domain-containing protein